MSDLTAEKIVLSDLSDDENDTLNRLLSRLEKTRGRNEKLAAYYDMHRLVRQVANVLPPMYSKLALTLGWAAKGVDALNRRCTLVDFEWADGDLASLGGRELWDANMLGSEARQGGLESLIHGPAFIVTTRGGEGEADALIHFRSALDATGDWNVRTRRLDNLVSIADRDDEGRVTRFTLYLSGKTVSAVRDRGVWSSDVSTHPWGVPADVMPYKPRIRRAFGSSRITRAARGLQDAGVRELLRLEGHMDVYSFPEFWLLGADETVFKNADGSVRHVWQTMLGRIKGIPDDQDEDDPALARADVKQFTAASPEPHLADLNTLAKLVAREYSLPDSSMAITDVSNPTSAEAYDASQYELIAEAEGTTDDWSPALRRAYTRALAIQNGEDAVPDEWRSIVPKWRNPRFLSRAAEADAGLKQLQAAPELSGTDVGYELLGLSPEQIASAKGELRRKAVNGRMDALIGLAGQQPAVAEAEPDGLAG